MVHSTQELGLQSKRGMHELSAVAEDGQNHWAPLQKLPFEETIEIALPVPHMSASRQAYIMHAVGGYIVTFSLGRRLTDGRTPQRQSLPCIVTQHLFRFARMAAWFQPRFQPDLCQSDISAFGANATILINRSLGWAQEEKNG